MKEVLKELQELNAEKITSYIILVREDIPNGEHSSKGINAIQGSAMELCTLLANLPSELIQKFLALKVMGAFDNDK